MTKKNPDLQVVAAVREGMLMPATAFPASDEQRRLKARFWHAFKSNPACDEKLVTPALVEQLIGVSLSKYSDPHFWEWFKTRYSVEHEIEIAASKAAELAVHYLDPSVPMNDNARVSLIKYVLEFSGRTPVTRKEVKWGDRQVAEMNEDELRAYIAQLRGTLPPSQE